MKSDEASSRAKGNRKQINRLIRSVEDWQLSLNWLRQMKKEGHYIAREKMEDGKDTNLHTVARNCSDRSSREELIYALLEMEPESLKVKGARGELPIHVLAGRKHASKENVEMLKNLVEKYPEGLKIQNDEGNLPIHNAALNKDTYYSDEIVKKLASMYREGLSQRNNDGDLPIHLAAFNFGSSEDIVCGLAEMQPQSIKVKGKGGNLPIHCLATSRRSVTEEALKKMVQKYPDGLKIQNDEGNLPVHLGAKTGGDYALRVKALARWSPEGVKQRNKHGQLPIHLAAEFENLHCMQVLAAKYPDTMHEHSGTSAKGDLPVVLYLSNFRCGLAKFRVEGVRRLLELNCKHTMGNRAATTEPEKAQVEETLTEEINDLKRSLALSEEDCRKLDSVQERVDQLEEDNGKLKDSLKAVEEEKQSVVAQMTDTKQVAALARESELAAHPLLLDSVDDTVPSREVLKGIAKSLKSRLDVLNAKTGSEPSMTQMSLALLIENPGMTRVMLAKAISTLNAELTAAENECMIYDEDVPEAAAEPRNNGAQVSTTPEPAKKRARVTPSL